MEKRTKQTKKAESPVKKLKALHRGGPGAYQRLETFPCPESMTRVTMISDEVTSLCPVTKQPDWYKVQITYIPSDFCIESKTLKLFFHSLRDKGMFCEALATYILKEIKEVASPKWMEVIVTQKSRGGISIIATAEE